MKGIQNTRLSYPLWGQSPARVEADFHLLIDIAKKYRRGEILHKDVMNMFYLEACEHRSVTLVELFNENTISLNNAIHILKLWHERIKYGLTQ